MANRGIRVTCLRGGRWKPKFQQRWLLAHAGPLQRLLIRMRETDKRLRRTDEE